MTNENLLELKQLLDGADVRTRTDLAEIVDCGFGSDPETLCNHVQFLRHGYLGQWFMKDDYKQLVTDVADRITVTWQLTGFNWALLVDRTPWKQLSAEQMMQKERDRSFIKESC